MKLGSLLIIQDCACQSSNLWIELPCGRGNGLPCDEVMVCRQWSAVWWGNGLPRGRDNGLPCGRAMVCHVAAIRHSAGMCTVIIASVCSDFIRITEYYRYKENHTIIVRIMTAGGDSLWPGNLLSLWWLNSRLRHPLRWHSLWSGLGTEQWFQKVLKWRSQLNRGNTWYTSISVTVCVGMHHKCAWGYYQREHNNKMSFSKTPHGK